MHPTAFREIAILIAFQSPIFGAWENKLIGS